MMKLIQECLFLLRCNGAIDRSYASLNICSLVLKLGCYRFLCGPIGVHLDGLLVPGKGDAA